VVLGGLCALGTTLLSAACAHAQTPPFKIATVPAKNCPVTLTAPTTDPAMRRVETGIRPALTGSATRPQTLAERMRKLKVPGVSVALIRQGRIAWTRGWGVRHAGTCAPVTPDTVFQAASISKPVAALLALRLVEQGKLDLDGDVNARLRRWRIPEDTRFPSGRVTLRQLLSHSAGTGVHGFMGYLPGTPRPNLVQMLDGKPPANSAAVRLEALPGAGFRYSGGGYMIVQTLIEDATGRSFAELAQREVLESLGMAQSRFAQPLARGEQTNAAAGHDGGRPIRGGGYIYPELAAAGLWATPADLARMLIDVRAATKEPGHIVSPQTAKTTLASINDVSGLGFQMWGKDTARRFGHYGGNLGFLSQAWINEASGDGIVIMTNGEGGMTLADDITRAVADELEWADFRSRSLTAALGAGPIYLRGTMNEWSTATPLLPAGPGVWSAIATLRPGDYSFKVASEDWKTVVLGLEGEQPILGTTEQMPLAYGANDIALKIKSAKAYRFALRADDTGQANLSISSE
jgi:CubicO group peptidase (beta-lactamase class C family)